MSRDLHKRLVERQSLEELQRKRLKADRKGLLTQEHLDWADKWAEQMYKLLIDESEE